MSVRSLLVVGMLGAGCGAPTLATSPLSICTFPPEHGLAAVSGGRPTLRIVYDARDAAGLRLAADVSAVLEEMTGVPFPFAAAGGGQGARGLLCNEAGCPLHAVAVGALAAAADPRPPPEGVVRTRRLTFDSRSVWLVAGAGTRDAAYAAHSFLAALGVRYLHPRRAYVPHRPNLALDLTLEQTGVPGFAERVWRLDTRRATPASWAFGTASESAFAEARRIIDWLVANGQTAVEWTLLDALPEAHTRRIVAYAHERGLRAGAALALLHGADRQLGLAAAGEGAAEVQARVAALAALGFDDIAVALDERELWRPAAARQEELLAAVERAVAAHRPAMRWRFTVLPGSAFPAGAAADLQAGPFPHPFTGATEGQLASLDRARLHEAGIVTGTAFGRGVDIDVPVFLPAYWYGRWADANRLLATPALSRQVTVDLGWEWGYWANAAVAFAAGWDRGRSFRDTAAHVFAPLGRNTCDRLVDTLAAAAAVQFEAMAGQGLAGEMTGAPDTFPAWAPWPAARSLAAPATSGTELRTALIAPLRGFLERWTELERGLVPTLPRIDDAARPFVQELIDGFVITRLKVSHRAALLEGLAEFHDGRPAAAAAALQSAREARNLAALIVAAREAQYRYGAEIVAGIAPNQTAYPYGYLRATRTLDAWTAGERELAAVIYGVSP